MAALPRALQRVLAFLAVMLVSGPICTNHRCPFNDPHLTGVASAAAVGRGAASSVGLQPTPDDDDALPRASRRVTLAGVRDQYLYTPCVDYLQALQLLQERFSPGRDVLSELRDELQTLRYLERVAHDADDM